MIAFVPIPNVTVERLFRLGELIEEVGLNEHDVTVKFDQGAPVLVVNFDASVTELQAELGIKSLVDCLTRAKAVLHPMISRIHPRVARAHPLWLH